MTMPASPPPPWPAVDQPLIEGDGMHLALTDLARDGKGLWRAIGARPDLWTYIPSGGPFADETAFTRWLGERLDRPEQRLYTILERDAEGGMIPAGLFFVLRILPAVGTAEIGLVYGPTLQRTVAGTRAFHLLTGHVLGTLRYRRWEWRTSPDNRASGAAALRFGFKREGLMRQTLWAKGRSWDTEVYALLDHEWPGVDARLRAWLAPVNFTPQGAQVRRLADC